MLTWGNTVLPYPRFSCHIPLSVYFSFVGDITRIIIVSNSKEHTQLPFCNPYLRFGRRIPLVVYFLIGGIALIIAASIPKTMPNGESIAWLSTALAWIGKFSTAGCWSVIFLYASELYPTLIRNVAVGACAFCARVGSLVAPQILLLVGIPIEPSVVIGRSVWPCGMACM